MTLKPFDEFPPRDGVYLTINDSGYVGAHRYMNFAWYESHRDQPVPSERYKKFSWIDMSYNG